ncbi:MAG: hypothetical protein KAI39_12395 [Desulfobulbaceae bacterium]|nr:hypothetical protein [Desulfobulbaceae bacterium]
MPEKWTQPIVNQIVLPAHAQTSGVPDQPVPDPPAAPKPILHCSILIQNLLNEDILLTYMGKQYTIAARETTNPGITMYNEPFTLTFTAATTTNKVLGDLSAGTNRSFTTTITVSDATCGKRYKIGTTANFMMSVTEPETGVE